MRHGFKLDHLPVRVPGDLTQVNGLAALLGESGAACLAYEREPQILPQPIVASSSHRPLQPTEPNLLREDNIGLTFPAISRGHDVYASRLRDVLCLPSGLIVTEDGHVFAESFRTPKSYLAPDVYVQRNGLKLNAGELTFDFANPPAAQDFDVIEGPAFFLDGDHFGSYGHMIGEVLTRLWPFLHLGFSARDFTILCGHGAAAALMPFLEPFGIRAGQLYFNRAGVVCRDLLVATQGMIVRQSASPAARMVWAQLRASAPRQHRRQERVYISRSDVASRKLLNESEVEALFADRGFAVVRPEKLSFHEQIELFAGARLLAGPSGSNMFNLVFASPDQDQMILTSENYIVHSELLMRPPNPVGPHYVIGIAERAGHVHSPWSVDCRLLADQLRAWA